MNVYKIRIQHKRTSKYIDIVTADRIEAESKDEAINQIKETYDGCKILSARKLPNHLTT